MLAFFLWLTIGLVANVILGSFYEWLMHRYVMHRPIGPFRYPFERHAVIHHHVFKADHTYHLIDEKDKHTIPMAWWNGPALITLFSLPTLAIAWATGLWPLLYGSLIAFTVYYAVYEYIHWCMHLPKSRRLEKSGIFFRLNGHHLLHHRYMHKNFNVVLPLADLCMGTLMRRSKIKFKQALGPAVPNVQPLSTPTIPSPDVAAQTDEELPPVIGVAGNVA
jgi:hypothetical protein